MEQEDEADNSKGPPQVNDIATGLTAKKVGATLPDRSLRLAEQLQLLSPYITLLALSYNRAGRHRDSNSGSKFNKRFNLDNNNRKLYCNI